jgi:hypothetical protein
MAAPTIKSFSPSSSGKAGSEVNIIGTGFGNTQGSSTVTFGSTTATVIKWSSDEFGVTVPSSLAAGATTVVVTVGGVASNGATFTVS